MSMPIAEPNLNDVERPSIAHDDRTISDMIEERLIGVSRWMVETRAAVAAHSSHDGPIIIRGELGTGKRCVARLIHECSTRRHGPFITIACDSVSEESVEAALFGWIRPVPSGGKRVQRGLVEAAKGGTLYINGAASLSPTTRARLSRLIKNQEFHYTGDHGLQFADVRILLGFTPTSISQKRDSSTAEGKVIGVRDILSIPPLRRRKADVEPLSRHFIRRACSRSGKELREIAPETISLLRRYDWPGNVAELKQVIEMMVQRSGPPTIDSSLLPASMTRPSMVHHDSLPISGISLNEELDRFERSLLCMALKQCRGVQARAARLLGLKLTTLNTKIARYGIDVTSFK